MKQFLRSYWVYSVLFLSGFLVTFPTRTFSQEKPPIPIGVILPLTGQFASWGEGIRRGIELFAESRQSKFRFVFEDEGNCEARSSVAAYRKLSSSGVHFMIVGCLAGTKAILPIAKKDSVLLLSTGLVDDSTFAQTSQLINLATQISTESRYLARRVNQRRLDRIAIIHWIDAFSDEFANTLQRELENHNIKVVSNEGVDPKEHDYRSILLRIKNAKADAICFNVGQDQQDVLLRQIRQVGIKVPVFSNYVYETPSVLNLGELATTVEYSSPLNSADSLPEKIDFDKKFEKRFGTGAQPIANSYFVRDGLTLLENALLKCSETDPDCVGKFFKSTNHFVGLSGDVSFHTDGSNDRPYGIKKVENGRFVWVDTGIHK